MPSTDEIGDEAKNKNDAYNEADAKKKKETMAIGNAPDVTALQTIAVGLSGKPGLAESTAT